MLNSRIAQYLGYCFLFYLALMVLISVGYPLARQYANPVASLVFPINAHNSVWKSLIVTSLMYWGFVMVPLFAGKPRK